jgi:hypothetical protein
MTLKMNLLTIGHSTHPIDAGVAHDLRPGRNDRRRAAPIGRRRRAWPDVDEQARDGRRVTGRGHTPELIAAPGTSQGSETWLK